MYQQHAPARRSWARRHRFAFVLLTAVTMTEEIRRLVMREHMVWRMVRVVFR